MHPDIQTTRTDRRRLLQNMAVFFFYAVPVGVRYLLVVSVVCGCCVSGCVCACVCVSCVYLCVCCSWLCGAVCGSGCVSGLGVSVSGLCIPCMNVSGLVWVYVWLWHGCIRSVCVWVCSGLLWVYLVRDQQKTAAERLKSIRPIPSQNGGFCLFLCVIFHTKIAYFTLHYTGIVVQ